VKASFSYNDVDRNVTKTTDLITPGDQAYVTVDQYDRLARIDNSTEPSGGQCASSYTTQHLYSFTTSGKFQAVSNPYCNSSDVTAGWTRTAWDTSGRVTGVGHYTGSSVPAPWGSNGVTTGSVTTAYNSNQTTVTDEAGKSRQNTVDAQGRLICVTEDPAGLGFLTMYSYDGLDDLITVNQNVTLCQNGQQSVQPRSFNYDALKRLVSATNPESGLTSYSSYDGNGNLLQKTDARSVVTTYTYDPLNRITNKDYANAAGTTGVNYQYDGTGVTCPVSGASNYPVGRLSSVSALGAAGATFQTNYECYDAFARVTHSTQSTAGTSYPFGSGGNAGYVYNAAGSLSQITYPSGRVVATGYDGAGRPSSLMTSGPQTYASGLTYAPTGGLTNLNLGNGLIEKTQYNDRLQPTSIRVGPATGAALLQLGFTYGATSSQDNGNVQTQTITAPEAGSSLTLQLTQTYGYDGVNRLTSAQETVPTSSLPTQVAAGNWGYWPAYDQYGNVGVTSTLALGPGTPTSPSQFSTTNNRLIADTPDAAGNVLMDANMGTMTYDGENRLLTFTPPNSGAITTYDYDGEGRRVRKTQTGGTSSSTAYVYDAAGQLTAEYSTATNPDAGTRYMTQDHLGSTRLVTTASGTVAQRLDYLPFGMTLAATPAEGNRNLGDCRK